MTFPETLDHLIEDLKEQGCNVYNPTYLSGDGRFSIKIKGEVEIGRYGTWDGIDKLYLVGDTGQLYVELNND